MPHPPNLLGNEDMFGAMNNNLLIQLFCTLSRRSIFHTGYKDRSKTLTSP